MEFKPDDSAIPQNEILVQIERILGSRHFRSAKSLERFLRHVVQKKLSGEENLLKEYSIGLEVFQRGANYDQRSDAVVRVQATLLRKKLANYYAEEGVNDAIVVELPKGHYVPGFRVRELSLVAQDECVSVCDPQERRQPDRWTHLLRVAATFLVGLLAAFAF